MDGKFRARKGPSSFRSIRRLALILPLTLILAVWSVLYLPHLRTSPAWYGDETVALAAGLDLTRGIAAHRAVWNTFWHPYAPYQPGYELLIGWFARLFKGDILGARIANTLLALGVALVIYLYGRNILGVLPALFAALLFISYEQSVIHFRWVFTHNLIALGFAITFLALSRPARRRNDIRAGAGLALSAAALPLFLYGCVPALLIRLKRPRSWPWLFVPAMAVVGSSLFLGWLMTRPNNFLLSDLAATLRFYTHSSQESAASIAQVGLNVLRFFTQDIVHLVGALMLLLCLCRRFYAIGLGGLTDLPVVGSESAKSVSLLLSGDYLSAVDDDCLRSSREKDVPVCSSTRRSSADCTRSASDAVGCSDPERHQPRSEVAFRELETKDLLLDDPIA